MRISLIVLGLIVIALIAFHFWFINHAKSLLEDTVWERSEGKLKLRIEKLGYDYLSREMKIRKAVFFSTDTATANTAYRFSVREISLRLKGILPLVVDKKLLIDSMHLQSPEIIVTTLRLSKDTTRKESRDVSLPYELGKVYHSIQDALRVLQVNRFHFNDGKFTLVNKATEGQQPLNITNIDFQIENLQVDTSRYTGQEKILFSDNVILNSHSQDIVFPDGRHRLAFSQFRINLRKKLVEFDSCTISAEPTDSSSSSFRVFFDTLKLTNIDFDTLYRAEVIKADSVYCLNPQFNLEVDAGKKKGSKKPLPKLENIVQQLTGDLLLGFVVVENASFNIKTIKDGQPNSFVFSNNNFEMQGLSVAHDAPKLIRVRSFAMAIRNYENFIKDSTYSIKFDSVRFRDDQIILSRFLFNKLDNGRILNTFSVPEFRLEGLSWDDLVFEKKLKARSATMYQPHINYTARNSPRKKQSIFESLGAVNEYMDLEQLDIIEGAIDLKLRNNLRLEMENATLSVKSQSLLSSTRLAGIKNSLIRLDFDHGKIQAGNTLIELMGILYKGENGQFGAKKILVSNKQKGINTELDDVAVGKMTVDERTGSILAENISWARGNISFASLGSPGGQDPEQVIDLKNIRGGPTEITGKVGETNLHTTLNELSVEQFYKDPVNKIRITGLETSGRDMKIKSTNLDLTTADYSFKDRSSSSFRQVAFNTNNSRHEAAVRIPSLQLVPYLEQFLEGNMTIGNTVMTNPVIEYHIKKKTVAKEKDVLPRISISQLDLQNPLIDFSKETDSGALRLSWNGNNGNNRMQLSQLRTGSDELSLQQLSFNISGFKVTTPNGKKFDTRKGALNASLNDINLRLTDSEDVSWQAKISQFEAIDLVVDSIGKNNGILELRSGQVRDFALSSVTIDDMQKIVAANQLFRLDKLTGSYNSNRSDLRWYNAGYERNSNSLFLDSITYKPTPGRDSFLFSKEYQSDYIRAGSGRIRVGPVDLDAFIRDTVLKVKKAEFDQVYFIDYRDKSLPFNAGIIKPLPVDMLKKLPIKFSVDSILFHRTRVEYTEVNDKNMMAGTIPITGMEIALFNVKNYGIRANDSLNIRATGMLMDKVRTRLHVKESYTDSLGGFLMTLRMQPTELSVFNSVLIPLASARVTSGKLDTLYMRAVGREYLSFGEMHMFYKDLKIEVLKKNTHGEIIPNRLTTFLANSFVIRKKNDSKSGYVFFIRNRDRSAINYLVKIAMSGISSSIGAKSNKKLVRQYEKELRQRSLPPIELE